MCSDLLKKTYSSEKEIYGGANTPRQKKKL